MCVSSEGSGQTVKMHRLSLTFFGGLCIKCQNLMCGPIIRNCAVYLSAIADFLKFYM